ncbi:MAG: potassium channel family protein [Salegentibacter sp.]
MNILLLIIGALLYLGIVVDILQTTLSLQGGGWLTSHISRWIWTIFLKFSGHNGKARILEHAGYILLVIIVTVWVFFLWLSFLLMLTSSPDSIVNGTTRLPADVWEKLYFAGYTISTLGMGDFVETADAWRILSTIYSFTGLILLTMSVTYFIPALSAVINQRKLAIMIRSLGKDPQDIILNTWDGKNFDDFFAKSSSLAEDLIMYGQRHRAYPVIHYFHQTEKETNIMLQLARLNEALQILKNCLPKEMKPRDQELASLEVAFKNYVKIITGVVKYKPLQVSVPEVKLDELRKKGFIDTNHKCGEMAEELRHTREVLHSMVVRDGWKWEDIHK